MSFKINRSSGEYEKDSNLAGWLKEFAKTVESKLPITAVERAREREQENKDYYASISNLYGSQPRYATVADAVKDMTDRTGLSAYLGKLKESAENKDNTKIANVINEVELPKALRDQKEAAQIATFIDNKLQYNNSMSPLQLQDEILKLFNVDIKDIYDPETTKYLSDKILENKKPELEESFSGLGKNFSGDIVDRNQNWTEILEPKKF